MVIDTNNSLSTSNSGARTKSTAIVNGESASRSNKAQPSAAPNKDSVVLSSEAQTLSRLEAQINASPEIDSARVAEIKEAIANGSFEINADRIAENMLNQDDLLG